MEQTIICHLDAAVEQYYSGGAASGVAWATLRNDTGNDVEGSYISYCYIRCATELADKWNLLIRGIIGFDTSVIPPLYNILAGRIKLRSLGKSETFVGAHPLPSANIYGATPTSTTELVAADYSKTQDVAFSEAVHYDDWPASGQWVTFSLNQAGLDAINKDGITFFSVKDANYDVANISPPWEASWHPGHYGAFVYMSFARQNHANEEYKPQLVLTLETVLSPRRTVLVEDKITLESIRNIEMAVGGRFYINEEGIAVYKSRYARNL